MCVYVCVNGMNLYLPLCLCEFQLLLKISKISTSYYYHILASRSVLDLFLLYNLRKQKISSDFLILIIINITLPVFGLRVDNRLRKAFRLSRLAPVTLET